MSLNKNAVLRYRILDSCFSNFQTNFSFADLLDTVNDKLNELYGIQIGIRQLREDIRFMRETIGYAAPIAVYRNGNKRYYRYSDENFSIFKTDLTENELKMLRSTIKMLQRYKGIPANAWLEEVIPSLEYRLGVKPQSENLVAFAQNQNLKGIEHLSGLIQAIEEHKSLKIRYRNYKLHEINTSFSPYYMKQYNGRWFLFAFNIEYNSISNLAIDRIVSFTESDVPFVKNNFVDFTTYFDDIIGVTIPPENVKKEKVILRFSPERFPYVVTKPLHHSQQLVEGMENTISLSVKLNRELESQLFHYVPAIEVIAPESLRLRFRQQLAECLERNTDKSL